MSQEKMEMLALGEEHARLHAKMELGYQPAAPDDAWFSAGHGLCFGRMYAAYYRGYRNACKEVGITLGDLMDRSFARFQVKPIA